MIDIHTTNMYSYLHMCRYRIEGNFRMVQIFVFFECTFRIRKFEHATFYITRGLCTRVSDLISSSGASGLRTRPDCDLRTS